MTPMIMFTVHQNVPMGPTVPAFAVPDVGNQDRGEGAR